MRHCYSKADFLKAHAQGLWQCDIFSRHVITASGVRQCFVLALIHVQSRRVWLSPCTFEPGMPWMMEQARALLGHAKGQGLPVQVVLRNRDLKYSEPFDVVLGAAGAEVTVPYRSPTTNAYIERFVQAVQQECLVKFILFGKEHMDHVVGEYVEHYHRERPHPGEGERAAQLRRRRAAGSGGGGGVPGAAGRYSAALLPADSVTRRCRVAVRPGRVMVTAGLVLVGRPIRSGKEQRGLRPLLNQR